MSEMEIARYDFLTRKYGDELLVDLRRIESLPGYVLDDTPHRLGGAFRRWWTRCPERLPSVKCSKCRREAAALEIGAAASPYLFSPIPERIRQKWVVRTYQI